MICLKKVTHLADGCEVSVFAIGEALLILTDKCPEAKWSGSKYPPAIGDRVKVNFNEFGDGTVLDYLVTDGWLGILVKIDKQPNWSIKQSGLRNEFTFYGAELNY
jgi:hypothetical protein